MVCRLLLGEAVLELSHAVCAAHPPLIPSPLERAVLQAPLVASYWATDVLGCCLGRLNEINARLEPATERLPSFHPTAHWHLEQLLELLRTFTLHCWRLAERQACSTHSPRDCPASGLQLGDGAGVEAWITTTTAAIHRRTMQSPLPEFLEICCATCHRTFRKTHPHPFIADRRLCTNHLLDFEDCLLYCDDDGAADQCLLCLSRETPLFVLCDQEECKLGVCPGCIFFQMPGAGVTQPHAVIGEGDQFFCPLHRSDGDRSSAEVAALRCCEDGGRLRLEAAIGDDGGDGGENDSPSSSEEDVDFGDKSHGTNRKRRSRQTKASSSTRRKTKARQWPMPAVTAAKYATPACLFELACSERDAEELSHTIQLPVVQVDARPLSAAGRVRSFWGPHVLQLEPLLKTVDPRMHSAKAFLQSKYEHRPDIQEYAFFLCARCRFTLQMTQHWTLRA